MEYNQNPSIAGAVTVTTTPAAAMVYNQNPSLVGAVTVTVTPASGMQFGDSNEIIGAVTVTATPAAGMQYNRNASLVGAVTVTATPASGMQYNKVVSIDGAVTVTTTPAATMDYEFSASIVGDITVTATPAATMQYQQAALIAGAVTVTIVPSAAMLYQLGVFDGSGYALGPDTFSNLQVQATADGGSGSNAILAAAIGSGLASNNWDSIERAVLLFSTHHIQAGDTIISASLEIRPTGVFNQLANVERVCVVKQSSTAINTDWTNSDYGNVSTEEWIARERLTNFSPGVSKKLDFNATGLAGIVKGGVTKLAVRLASDVDNSAPTWASNKDNYLRFYSEEGAVPPVLTVTYIPAAQTVTPSLETATAAALSGSVSTEYTLAPSLETASATVFTPTLSLSKVIPALETASAALLSHQVIGNQYLALGLQSATGVTFSATRRILPKVSSPLDLAVSTRGAKVGDTATVDLHLRMAGGEPVPLSEAQQITAFLYDEDGVQFADVDATVVSAAAGHASITLTPTELDVAEGGTIHVLVRWAQNRYSVAPSERTSPWAVWT